MHHQPRGLSWTRDHGLRETKRDVLALRLAGRRGGNAHIVVSSGLTRKLPSLRLAPRGHGAGFDQRLEPREADIGERCGEEARGAGPPCSAPTVPPPGPATAMTVYGE